MSSRLIYGISGIIVTAGTAVVINLLSAAIQQRAFSSQFNEQTIWVLAGLAIVGAFVGYWLGEKLKLSSSTLPTPTSSATSTDEKPDTVTMTRLNALLSYAKLKGKGIHLSDIVLIGSRIDIES